MMGESVILVDESDNMLGTMDKMAAHRLGRLHRAFSVFVFNDKGQLLLQQRAYDKYHSAGKWSNTCCSHPRPGEQNIDAANRRLREEMGIDCALVYGFSFIYKAEFDNGITEYEFDHVFYGTTSVLPSPDRSEVAASIYMSSEELKMSLKNNPDEYTEWFKICFERVMQQYCQQQKND